jgi:acetate kinase
MSTSIDNFSGRQFILTINGGSSSIKIAIFSATEKLTRVLSGQIAGIGQAGTQLTAREETKEAVETRSIDAGDFDRAAVSLVQYLQERLKGATVVGIGHRIVHGGAKLIDHQLITPEVITELQAIQYLDLAHLPAEISLIEAVGKSFNEVRQIACFDTAFHRDMPRVASMLPIPRRYFDAGVRRFGFHGLSYTYLMGRLAEVAGAEAANGRVILAHLGAGASMAAVRGGKSVDTTMAFTPTAGLVMGTRPGDLDPGVLVYLMRSEKLSAEQMDDFISKQCGLLGVSETTSDMQDLIKRRDSDSRAAEAIDLFCYQAKKFIGALAAAMDGVDTLIFSGGIGEHAATVRAQICEGLTSLGIGLDLKLNDSNADVISGRDSRVTVRVIATDEELVIARAVCALS